MNLQSAELINKFGPLLNTTDLPSLGPGSRKTRLPIAELEKQFQRVVSICNVPDHCGDLIKSLLLLWHDHLDESHSICQNISSADGSFVHAIVHRREPDYWNSKYWFNRVGDHPAFQEIAKEVETLCRATDDSSSMMKLIKGGKWHPTVFVDLCEQYARQPDSNEYHLLQTIQQIETRQLLAHICQEAVQ